MRLLVWDTETTGFSTTQGARVIELAAVVLDVSAQVTEVSHFGPQVLQLEPDATVSPRALEVNGFTLERISQGRAPRQVWQEFVDWLLRLLVPGERLWHAGHNIQFDVRFLKHAMEHYQLSPAHDTLFEPDVARFDTERLARLHFPNLPNVKLATLTEHLAISHAAHTAMGDVEACVEVLKRVWGLQ